MAEDLGPAVDVVGDPSRRQGADYSTDEAPASKRQQPGRRRRRAHQPDRPPVAAVSLLLLDHDGAADLTQPRRDPLRGHALAVGSRRLVDQLEVAHHLLELGPVGLPGRRRRGHDLCGTATAGRG